MSLKIAAYITAYLDQDAVWRCIEGIHQQTWAIETIFIFDNSPSPLVAGTPSLKVIHAPQNLGIGEGLTQVLKEVVGLGYDFLWTFDQDSIPSPNCLEILLSNYHQISRDNYQIGIIAPTAIDTRNQSIIEGANFRQDHFFGTPPQTVPYECDSPITSGSLLNLSAVPIVGYPRADLFMDGVDLDYGLRLKQQGFHNLIIPEAILHHHFGKPNTVKWLGKAKTIQNYPPLRHYYICRNHTYLETRYAQGIYRWSCSLKRFKYCLYTIIKIVLYDSSDRLPKILACGWGTFDGFRGKLGKRVDV